MEEGSNAALKVSDVWFAHRVDVERERLLEEPISVLEGVSFELGPKGFRAVLVGSNGVGKTTLLRLCAGVGTLSRGSIDIHGLSWSDRRALTPRIALVGALNWGNSMSASVEDIVRGAEERAMSSEQLKELRRLLRLDRLIARKAMTDALSDGERRCVQLFVALSPPSVEIAFIDEALTELDVTVRAALYKWLRRSGLSILMATHVFDGLDNWPTHVVVLEKKKARVIDYTSDMNVYETAREALHCEEIEIFRGGGGSEEVVVEVKDLSWSYDATAKRPAVNGASFRIGKGRRVVLCGANGSSKSTTLALVAGFRVAPFAAADAIRVLGEDPRCENLRAHGRVAFLGSAFKSGLDDLPARARNVTFEDMLKSAKGDEARYDCLMELLEVQRHWRPATASAGQTTRMQLVLQLATRADLYLVDELTRDLDLVARDKILDYLKRQSIDYNATIVYATHIFQGLDDWATDLLHARSGTIAHHLDLLAKSPETPLYDRVVSWLEEDDEHFEDLRSDLVKTQLRALRVSPEIPVGWASRDNTVEASYGSHAWSAKQAHGIYADQHSTTRQKFEALYLAGGTRR